MYTRCPSIANMFQKAISVKDAKCNKIIQRQFRSISLANFSKIDNKLKPMKRRFSGASNNRNFMQKTRNLQGVGIIRKSLPRKTFFIPKFPREMVRQQSSVCHPLSLRQLMPPSQFQNIQQIVGNRVESQSVNENDNSKITIVIDKNEICSLPNEDVKIHVTTIPESKSKRVIEALSEAETGQIGNRMCNCCQRREEAKKLGMPIEPNPNEFKQPSNDVNFSSQLPRPTQNVYGIPLRNLSSFDEARSFKMETLKKNRSMSDFPTMRKMLVPTVFEQIQTNVGRLPMKMQQSPPVYGVRSHCRLNTQVAFINNQPQPLQRSNMQRSFSHQSLRNPNPNEIHLPKQQARDFGTLFGRPEQVKRSSTGMHPTEYNSYQQVVARTNVPVKPPNAESNEPPKNKMEISQNGFNGFDKRSQRPRRLIVPVIRPAMFSSTNNTNNNLYAATALKEIAEIQKIRSAAVLSHKQKAAELFDGPFLRNPNRFNMQETTTKNKFPAGRASVLRALPFQSPNVLSLSQRGFTNNISKNNSQAGLRSQLNTSSPIEDASIANMFSKNNSAQPTENLLKQKSAHSISHGNSSIQQNMVNQKHFLVQRQSPPVVKEKTELRPALMQNNQITKSLPFYPNNRSFQPTYLSHSNQPGPVILSAHRKNNIYSQQPSRIGMFGRNPSLVNLQEMSGKNRLPPKTESLRKMLPMQSQNSLNQVQRSYRDDFSKRISHVAPSPIIPPYLKFEQKSNNQLFAKQRSPALMPTGRLNNKKPPHIVIKKRSIRSAKNHPQMNRHPYRRRRRSFIPLPQKSGLLQRNVTSKQDSAQKKRTTPLQASMIPVRQNVAQILPRNDLPQKRQFKKMCFTSKNKCTHPHPHDFAKQRRSISANQLQKQSDVRRMNQEKLQSSLPVTVTNPPNQIEKYVELPKPIQTVKRPYSSPGNLNPLRFNETLQRPTLPFKNLRVPDNAVQMQQISQARPMNRQTNSPQEQFTTQADNMKATPPASPQMKNFTTKVDKSKRKNVNPAVLFYAPGKLRLVNIPVPRLADDKGVIVKMLYVHLTDTDSIMLSSMHDSPYKLTQPTIAGKSGSGLIVDVGKKVENVKIGDKVSVKGLSCGECTACENDNEVICERIPIVEKLGILKRFHAVPSKFVTKLPDSVHPIDGAMIDELSTAIRACKKSTLTAGDNVLVLGGKSLGLWTALAAKSMGATNVCLADSRQVVLEQAKKLGIDRVFLINPDSPVSKTSKSISDYMDGESPRIVFDCNGSPLTNEIAINTTLVGGKVVLMKNSISNQPIGLSGAVDRGIDILSSQHGTNDSERAALQFLASRKVQLSGIDSSFFDISNVHEAFGLLNSGTISNIFVQPSQLDNQNPANKKSKSS